MNDHRFPSAFVGQMKVLLPTDFEAFGAALTSAPPVSIRINRSKISPGGLSHLPLAEQVSWHPDAYYLSERPNFTLDPLFHAGAYYVQEASSMFLREVLEQSTGRQRPLKILDLCAAPGGKTTLIASWMPEGSILVANEVIRSRVSVLKQNLARWGHPGVFTCSYDPEAFLPLAGWFDLVVVDAPCSGEGLFRKNDLAPAEWSPENVALCAARQKRILNVAQKLVNPKGTLIYSTCTYNKQENDLNTAWLRDEKGMMETRLEIPEQWGVSRREQGYQLYPHKVQGEGFYIAALTQLEPVRAVEKRKRDFKKLAFAGRKELEVISGWINDTGEFVFLKTPDGQLFHAPAALVHDLLTLDFLLPHGVWLHETGQIKGKDYIPSHMLALQNNTLRPGFPSIDLDETQSLQYLKKELNWVPASEKGWYLAKHKKLPLGWLRHLGNRFNNYYPTEQRIRMEIV